MKKNEINFIICKSQFKMNQDLNEAIGGERKINTSI